MRFMEKCALYPGTIAAPLRLQFGTNFCPAAVASAHGCAIILLAVVSAEQTLSTVLDDCC